MGRGRVDLPVDGLLAELDRFTGPAWEQEDDITLVTLERAPQPVAAARTNGTVLAAFELASVPGNEREAMERVAAAVARLGIAAAARSSGCGPPSPRPR